MFAPFSELSSCPFEFVIFVSEPVCQQTIEVDVVLRVWGTKHGYLRTDAAKHIVRNRFQDFRKQVFNAGTNEQTDNASELIGETSAILRLFSKPFSRTEILTNYIIIYIVLTI